MTLKMMLSMKSVEDFFLKKKKGNLFFIIN